MITFPLPADEADRLLQLASYDVVGSPPEPAYDAIVDAAARLFDVPIGLIAIMGQSEQWLKAHKGLDLSQTPRAHSLCTHTILTPEPMVVPNTLLDLRFATSPFVLGEMGIRFYAGAPILNDAGVALGALCVIDRQPRHNIDPANVLLLARLAQAVALMLDQRRDVRLRNAVDGFARSSGLALVTTDPVGQISFWNPAAEVMFGYNSREAVGRRIEMIIPDRFRRDHARGMERVRAGGEPRLAGRAVEVVGLHRDGHEFPIEISLSTWTSPQGREFGAQIQDISVRRARDLRLYQLAKHDPLTGLLNRREFSQELEGVLAKQAQAGVLVLGLDRFKVVNDTLGHPVGDDLLRLVAVRLTARIGADAVLARKAGDKFAVLLPGCDDLAKARATGEALLSAFQKDFHVAGHEFRLRASVGFALAPHHARDAEELLARADLALLEAKRGGGDQMRLFDDELERRLAVQRAFQDEIRQATLGGQWVLHYQPQVRLFDGRAVGAEALLRWRHPTRGLIAPALFLSTLETHAMAGEVGRWVIDEACAQLVRWRAAGLDVPRVSVNLFAVQLRQGGLERPVFEALERHGLALQDLELELTETIALSGDARAVAGLHALRRAGLRLAFDDFGTGFASLTTLKDIAVDKVKIDQSFVKDLPANPYSRAITASMVRLARELGLEVVAEGVETPEQRQALMDLGCEAGQGYLWGRPAAGVETFASLGERASKRVGSRLVRRAEAVQTISEADNHSREGRLPGGQTLGQGKSNREGNGLPISETVKLDLCAREPIDVPGSIQPHGLLLVLDVDTRVVLQTAGDPKVMLGTEVRLPGASLAAVLGGRLDALLREDGRELGSVPVYLGDLQASPQHPALSVTAHRLAGRDVVEIEPAGPSSPAPAMLSFVRASVGRMNEASSLEDACRSIAADVRQLTGLDRVMIYRFLEDVSGSVIAEQKLDALPSFLHHRYPASDIPPQARELYRRNPIRVIPDVDYVPSPLTPALVPGAGQPLDMSQCSLRSVSPIHIQYMKNMGVGASMSVSILRKGELWGLIACHHGGPRLVPFEVREVCQHLGQALSHHIEAREDAEENRQRLELGRSRDRIFDDLAAASDPKTFLRERIADIQALIPAHGVVAYGANEAVSSGHVPHANELTGLAEWVIQAAQPSGVFATDCLSEHYAVAGDFTVEASGLLAVVLPGDRPVVLMWFRAEQVEEVLWAGNPHEAMQIDASNGSPSPRKSFALWAETVRGRSRPWSRVEVDAAPLLRSRAALVLQEHRIRQMNMQVQSANKRLAALARTDDLTGLANRRALGERLTEEWARVARYGRSLAVLAIDVDHFKSYNDHLGHQAGDECLRKVARALGAAARSTDFPARSGGEEFVILLPETELVGAQGIAEDVRTAVERLRIPHPASASGIVTVSLGVVATANVLGTPEGLLHEADKALYSAKGEGRNRVAVAHVLLDASRGDEGGLLHGQS